MYLGGGDMSAERRFDETIVCLGDFRLYMSRCLSVIRPNTFYHSSALRKTQNGDYSCWYVKRSVAGGRDSIICVLPLCFSSLLPFREYVDVLLCSCLLS